MADVITKSRTEGLAERQARVGAFMRELRESRGLSLEEMAGRFSLSPGAIQRIENGTTYFSKANVESCAVALGAVGKIDEVRALNMAVGHLRSLSHEERPWKEHPFWRKTLYRPLREVYEANGLTGTGTLVIGSGYGDDMPRGFRGVLADVDYSGIEFSAKRLKGASAIVAEGGQLPFRDRSFDSVVISLVLSQIHGPYALYREAILGEAMRTARERVVLIDTIRKMLIDSTGSVRREIELIDLARMAGDGSVQLAAFEWQHSEQGSRMVVFEVKALQAAVRN